MVLLLLLLAISGLLASFVVLATDNRSVWPARRVRPRRLRARVWPVSPLAEFAPLVQQQAQGGHAGEQRRQQRQDVQPPLRIGPVLPHYATFSRSGLGRGDVAAVGRPARIAPARYRQSAAAFA